MLSIIIATLNEEKCLPLLLADLKNQDYKDFETIVVDGNSDDKTATIARDFGCQVIVVDQRHQTYQQNLGAKEAKGDLLLFLDADVRIKDPLFLSVATRYFVNHNLGVATFYTSCEDKEFGIRVSAFLMNFFALLGNYIVPSSNGGFGIMSQKLLHQKVHGFNEQMFVGYDHEYAKKIKKLARFRVIPSVRVHASFRRFRKEGVLKVWFKWYYFLFMYALFGSSYKSRVAYEMGGSK